MREESGSPDSDIVSCVTMKDYVLFEAMQAIIRVSYRNVIDDELGLSSPVGQLYITRPPASRFLRSADRQKLRFTSQHLAGELAHRLIVMPAHRHGLDASDLFYNTARYGKILSSIMHPLSDSPLNASRYHGISKDKTETVLQPVQ